jgi:hypothetical protein
MRLTTSATPTPTLPLSSLPPQPLPLQQLPPPPLPTALTMSDKARPAKELRGTLHLSRSPPIMH